jgi:hypothetical protein
MKNDHFPTKLGEKEGMLILFEGWPFPSVLELHLIFFILEGQVLPLEASLCSQIEEG